MHEFVDLEQGLHPFGIHLHALGLGQRGQIGPQGGLLFGGGAVFGRDHEGIGQRVGIEHRHQILPLKRLLQLGHALLFAHVFGFFDAAVFRQLGADGGDVGLGGFGCEVDRHLRGLVEPAEHFGAALHT